MNNELFSVIVLHYNQPSYVYTALDSVLNQNYGHIELIFADDASHDIDKEAIEKYISDKKGDNIENVIYVYNEENMGTVKTINRAVKSAGGSHMLFFAADDALYDENVIANFIKAFDKADDDVYMISSQCLMMDEELKETIETFVHHTQAVSFNKMSAEEQFRVFACSCFLAIGATAMSKDMFEKFGYFNEEYKFIEDWAYFLYLTRSGGKIQYSDFNGLLHRDGGISHYLTKGNLPPHVLQYKLDTLHITENEIFPYFKIFSPQEKLTVFERYRFEKQAYYAGGGTQPVLSEMGLAKVMPRYYIHRLLGPFMNSWIPVIKSIRVLSYVALIFFTAVFAGKALGTNIITEIITIGLAAAFYALAVIAFLIVILSLGLRCLKILQKIFKR